MDSMDVASNDDVENFSIEITYSQLPPKTEEEWIYAMRRSMQEIIPGLYLGPLASASVASKDTLLQAGITHIVCVRSPIERHIVKPRHPNNFKYLIIEIDDDNQCMPGYSSLIPHFKNVHDFLDECFSSNGKGLVYGIQGSNGSAAFVLSYMMAKYGISAKDALDYAQRKRHAICLLDGYMRQLKEFEPIYKAKHQVAHLLPGIRTDERPQELSLKRGVPNSFDTEHTHDYNSDNDNEVEQIEVD